MKEIKISDASKDKEAKRKPGSFRLPNAKLYDAGHEG
jgi:hypothetical protein